MHHVYFAAVFPYFNAMDKLRRASAKQDSGLDLSASGQTDLESGLGLPLYSAG